MSNKKLALLLPIAVSSFSVSAMIAGGSCSLGIAGAGVGAHYGDNEHYGVSAQLILHI